jgi:hypothetical protein
MITSVSPHMQADYDLWRAERLLRNAVGRIERIKSAA